MSFTSRTIVIRVVVVASGALLVLAGLLSVQAARLRWSGPCAGSFDDPTCITVQDHLYDYLLPSDPWVQIPGAAELAGVSHLLVAGALALLSCTVRMRHWVRAVLVLLIVAYSAVGLATLISGRRGQATALLLDGGTTSLILMMTSWGLAFVVLAAYVNDDWFGGPLPRWSWLVISGALVLATPLPEYFLVVIAVGYGSHDTHPWTGAWSGGMFLVAGCAVLAGLCAQAAGLRLRRPVPR